MEYLQVNNTDAKLLLQNQEMLFKSGKKSNNEETELQSFLSAIETTAINMYKSLQLMVLNSVEMEKVYTIRYILFVNEEALKFLTVPIELSVIQKKKTDLINWHNSLLETADCFESNQMSNSPIRRETINIDASLYNTFVQNCKRKSLHNL